jgi:predicted AlkP superfamily phosphohydrolase/phosphomutase
VKPEEYSELLEQLKKDIEGISVENGKPLTVEVFRGSELYYGDYADYGPDMLVHIKEGMWRTDQRVGFGLERLSTQKTKRRSWRAADGSDTSA